MSKNCFKFKRQNSKHRETPKSFVCEELGHIAQNCTSRPVSGKHASSAELAMVWMPQAHIMNGADSLRISSSWIMDIACTSHMTNNKKYFRAFKSVERSIQMGNNELSPSFGVGTVRIVTNVNERMHNVVLRNVSYAPEIAYNLIPVSKICRKDFMIRIDGDSVNHRRGLMMVVNSVPGETKIADLVTDAGLYRAFIKASESEKAHIASQNCLQL